MNIPRASNPERASLRLALIGLPGGLGSGHATETQGVRPAHRTPMTYDLDIIKDLCGELGLRTVPRSEDRVAVELGHGVVLIFVTADEEEDAFIGFEDVGWHFHGDLPCSDRHGFCKEVGYLDILIGLADGTILTCEVWRQGVMEMRSLVHRDFVDEFRFLQEEDEVRVRRPRLRRGAD
jgi:hypothetical protein